MIRLLQLSHASHGLCALVWFVLIMTYLTPVFPASSMIVISVSLEEGRKKVMGDARRGARLAWRATR